MIRNVKKVQNLVPVKNAFISVYNKNGLKECVENLFEICPDVTIFSSGGTYSYLKEFFQERVDSKQIVEASKYTGMPEIDGGLVKTLHHKFFLGYLTETFSELHQKDLLRENAVAIDLVIVDLYPFQEVVKKEGTTAEECRGNIDVGGPSALRAAAKNYLRVMTIPEASSDNYNALISNLRISGGFTSLQMRMYGACDTFNALAYYDTQISNFFSKLSFDQVLENYEIV